MNSSPSLHSKSKAEPETSVGSGQKHSSLLTFDLKLLTSFAPEFIYGEREKFADRGLPESARHPDFKKSEFIHGVLHF